MIFSAGNLLYVMEIAFWLSTSLVSACEGECITGITNAFIGNYTAPLNNALGQIADTIAAELIPNNKNVGISLLSPVVDEYHRRAYDYMENAIFKSCFHGKCLDPDTGLEPAGCPNPDCPLICGTPGSLIHFYSKLRYIVFNGTAGLFSDIMNTDSAAYRKVEQGVIDAASSNRRRRYLRFNLDLTRRPGEGRAGSNLADIVTREETQIRRHLHSILRRFRGTLATICGGHPSDDPNGLPSCSWQNAFHDYILSFP